MPTRWSFSWLGTAATLTSGSRFGTVSSVLTGGVGGPHRDFIPSSWVIFIPTCVDIWTFVGTLGIFTSLFLLFIRFLPMIAMSEVKIVLPEADVHAASPNGEHPATAGGMERT